ncbi:MAG TPA: glycoside hydrolase family 99-like domain-containing protein [Candidatus Hydrogenedentes bacterium]|nr:glycoside hydrolase family 99-like domain-containing protein [Candidatus Hydrogenedentota bacterium]HPO30552.1 glycoside hydrolase family 99-like domain-containing protein [Candidatus Hydrogenedentota bacterium]
MNARWLLVILLVGIPGLAPAGNTPRENDDYTVAAYYFPSYHPNPAYDRDYGKGFTEWDLVRAARPRFEGHDQPKAPLWGFDDESDPARMAMRIDAAANHGVDVFIFDWYWHEGTGPFLHLALEKGFLAAPNNQKLKFALMWANHDWYHIHPARPERQHPLLHPGRVSAETFKTLTDHVIRTYMTRPNYWRVNGGAYFSIYELMTLVDGLGGVEKTRAALDDFRKRADAAGVGPLHLNAVVWGVQILPGEQTIRKPEELLPALGIDSVTSYCWIHHVYPDSFPTAPYRPWMEASIAKWPAFEKQWPVPYFPNVSMGWDPSPRTTQDGPYENIGYPYTSIITGNTPELFRQALEAARALLRDRPPAQRILTVNAWNEWTEGSYLEPDTRNGMAYLEAIRTVFGPGKP